MPVIQSAKKALRRDRHRYRVNLRIKHLTKEAVKKTRRQPTKENLHEAFRQLDRAAKKHVFHQNKAARLKSRLSKLVTTDVKKSSKKPAAKR